MTSEVPQQMGAGDTAGQLLAVASGRVAERTRAAQPEVAEQAEQCLAAIQGSLDRIVRGEDPRRASESLPSGPLVATLIQAVGRELMFVGSEEGIVDAAMPVLTAWAALQGARLLESTPDERLEDLGAQMRSANAFELLVEVAHDFRSPLTSILFLAEALRDGHSGPVTDVQRSQLGLIYSAALGLASIASDVVDLARREKDLIEDEAEPFALSEVFSSVERMVRPLVEEKGLELRIVVPDRWQASGHPHALGRVLLNLTTNALKFTDDGTVELGAQLLQRGRLQYYVEDTGRGISPEQQRQLFQPFRRRPGEGADGRYFSGSGVGLSIARRLVRAMGSELQLDRSDERGTRFSFEMPASTRH